MSIGKKLFAFLLTALMLVSLLPPTAVPAFAAESTVKLRFHGANGFMTEIKFTSGSALHESNLKLPDSAFGGWYYDVKFERQAQPGDVIDKDTDLYLKMTKDQTEYNEQQVVEYEGTASVFSSVSPIILLTGCALLVLAIGAAAVVSKKRKV